MFRIYALRRKEDFGLLYPPPSEDLTCSSSPNTMPPTIEYSTSNTVVLSASSDRRYSADVSMSAAGAHEGSPENLELAIIQPRCVSDSSGQHSNGDGQGQREIATRDSEASRAGESKALRMKSCHQEVTIVAHDCLTDGSESYAGSMVQKSMLSRCLPDTNSVDPFASNVAAGMTTSHVTTKHGIPCASGSDSKVPGSGVFSNLRQQGLPSDTAFQKYASEATPPDAHGLYSTADVSVGLPSAAFSSTTVGEGTLVSDEHRARGGGEEEGSTGGNVTRRKWSRAPLRTFACITSEAA